MRHPDKNSLQSTHSLAEWGALKSWHREGGGLVLYLSHLSHVSRNKKPYRAFRLINHFLKVENFPKQCDSRCNPISLSYNSLQDIGWEIPYCLLVSFIDKNEKDYLFHLFFKIYYVYLIQGYLSFVVVLFLQWKG